MVDILQTTSLKSFRCLMIVVFWFTASNKQQVIIRSYAWLFGAEQTTSHYQNKWSLSSLLIRLCVTRPWWVKPTESFCWRMHHDNDSCTYYTMYINHIQTERQIRESWRNHECDSINTIPPLTGITTRGVQLTSFQNHIYILLWICSYVLMCICIFTKKKVCNWF